MDSLQRRHRRAVSTPKNIVHAVIHPAIVPQTPPARHVSPPSSPHTTRTSASRILGSVKRSLTPSSKNRGHEKPSSSRPSGVYSTPEERMSPNRPNRSQPPHFLTPDDILAGSAPPTVEQIAMGLHLSRTPHLRPLGAARPRGKAKSEPLVLPPPPARSSMKKPSGAAAPMPVAKNSDTLSSTSTGQWRAGFTGSSTTVTSVTTPPSSESARSSGPFSFSKFRLTKFLPGSRSSSLPSSSILSTPASSPRQSSSEFDVSQKKAVRFEGPVDD
ncbi:hypothetical protein FA13DRAFT_1754153 [Coprinellus micaceus]|uniref:Uncharacterized protein n=1 Tax=Coprinellus micaceus TaxID=71717 RepID=A0A4Y7THL8_COPMI|nr:hypothetical protein FA13DRAFT_1754153 [Coprinellus micaceus]